ncbi:type II secretion system protein [Candidatus Saccharibacteria bacterium]|nr:type II secretion system protein [Candidatus Saccharibacteria bacterium]
MPNKLHKSKSGFTIIEVVLVLAIAGLIFLMVFLALPALQRSQKDTQRRNDMARFASQVVQYQTNNRGKVPNVAMSTGIYAPSKKTAYEEAGYTAAGALAKAYVGTGGATASGATPSADWTKFLDDYMWAANDDFVDPGGLPYAVQDHGSITGKTTSFNDSMLDEQEVISLNSIFLPSAMAEEDEGEGEGSPAGGGAVDTTVEGQWTFSLPEVDSLIHVVHGAICGAKEGVVEKSANASARKIAFIYKLEGAGYYCGEV